MCENFSLFPWQNLHFLRPFFQHSRTVDRRFCHLVRESQLWIWVVHFYYRNSPKKLKVDRKNWRLLISLAVHWLWLGFSRIFQNAKRKMIKAKASRRRFSTFDGHANLIFTFNRLLFCFQPLLRKLKKIKVISRKIVFSFRLEISKLSGWAFSSKFLSTGYLAHFVLVLWFTSLSHPHNNTQNQREDSKRSLYIL